MPWLSCIVSNVVLASLMAFVAWFVQRRLRRHSVARILWVLALVKLVTPPLVSVPLLELPASMACALGACGCELHSQPQTIASGALPWALLFVWSAGAVATGATAWRRWTRFRRLLAHAEPAPRQWRSRAAQLASELSIRRPPELLAVPGRLPPLVIAGWRRPRMLLPMALMARLSDSQKNALLLHELVHIKSGDHWVRMLELTVRIAFWWLPGVGSIGRQLRACEEARCDAAVAARLPQSRRDYAQLLLDVLDFADPLPRQAVAQATAMSAVGDLEQRLHGILDPNQAARRTWPAGAFAAGLACAVLPCKLHYEFVRSPAPAAISAEREPAAEATRSPIGDYKHEISAGCCPS